MKYIIVKDSNEDEYAIVFPDQIIHKNVARIHRVGEVVVVSGGFCNLQTLVCWGESETLGKKSRPEDSAILAKDYAP